MFCSQFLDDTFAHKAWFGPTLSNHLNTKEPGAAPSTDPPKSHPHSVHIFPTHMLVHIMLEEKVLNTPLWVIKEQNSKAVHMLFWSIKET